jgi:hypothetical protein
VVTSGSTPTSGDCAIVNWRWEWGHNGAVETGFLPTASHDFPTKGATYTVTLTVTNSQGMTTATFVNVTTLS